MRITTSMMSGQVVFNMQRAIQRYSDLQEQMSTGRRINRPSDDPLGTLRDLNYRTELSKIDQFRRNISQGQSWTGTYDYVLSDMTDFINGAKELAQSMANDDKDASIRENTSRDIQSKIDQILFLANKEINGSRIFGGYKTKVNPFQQAGNGVVYKGDNGAIQFEIGTGQLMAVNFDGNSVFMEQLKTLGEDADLNNGVVGTTLLADLHNSDGTDLGTFTITDINNNGRPVSTVDLTGLTTVDDAINAINTQLAADGYTNLTARLGDEGNNIVLESTEDGIISPTALVANLNSGNGVDLSTGKIRVTNGTDVDVVIDLSGSQTVADIMSKFNTQLNTVLGGLGYSNVNMTINASDTGFDITDTNGVPLGIEIQEMDISTQTAVQLGIFGGVPGVLNGTDLKPATHFEVAEGSGTAAADLGIFGTFNSIKIGDDLDPILTAASLLSDLKNGLGFSNGEIVLHQGMVSHTVDLSNPAIVTMQDLIDNINSSGLDLIASVNSNGTGLQIVNNDTSKSFVIGEGVLGNTAKEIGLFGSSDVIGGFIALRNALQKDDRLGSELLVGEMENSLQHVLNFRAAVGGRAVSLDFTDRRHLDANVNLTRLLSEEEDADLTELVTSLATFENNYQAALMSAAKIIQPTLLDFLR